MIKLLTIIGARPQIIKAAALSRAISSKYADKIKETLVHTGQHYDKNMSSVFFEELGIPEPDFNLGVGSGSHAVQTAKMLHATGELIESEKPTAVVLYGDTNSTLAAAMAASKLHVPIIHIEGGLRSHTKIYPEEINRILTDHVSSLIFTPTVDGYANLLKEGFSEPRGSSFTIDNPGVFHCGDIMYDNSIYFSEIAEKKSDIIERLGLTNGEFVLVTIHRENNTNDASRLRSIFKALLDLSNQEARDFVIPLHPRTSKLLSTMLDNDLAQQVKSADRLKIIEPVSFLDIILLEKGAKIIMTDSGGVQKEAFFFKKPSLIFLHETPWIELIDSGCALLVDASYEKIIEGYRKLTTFPPTLFPEFYGDAHASEFICDTIINNYLNE